MPWHVVEGGGTCKVGEYAVIKDADGATEGCHPTKEAANRQMAALYANEDGGQRMTAAEQADNPLDAIPEWARPLLPDWVNALRDRAVTLDDIELLSRAKGGDGRTVVAYAAVFDSPAEVSDQDGHYREQIHPAAFNRSIRDRAGKINVFYNHGKDLYGQPSDRFAIPIGTPLEITADSRGLKTTTRYNQTALATELLEAIKSGSMRGMSFTGAFLQSTPKGPYYRSADGELPLVTRSEIALIEYGPTPIPNYDDAEVVGVRSGQLEDGAQRISTAPWDGGANVARLSNDAGAATYRKAYAALRTGADPDLKGSWVLPHHMVNSDGSVGEANLAGVRNALARLPQTQGLASSAKASAESHLRAHLPAESPAREGGRSDTLPESEPEPVSDQPISDQPAEPPAGSPAPSTDPEPPVSPAPSTETPPQARTSGPQDPPRRGTVADQPMTAQERVVRQGEIRERMKALDGEYAGAELPTEIKDEWDAISEEFEVHERAIAADAERKERIRQLGEADQAGERVDGQRSSGGYRNAPAVHRSQRPEDIYDLVALRQRARSVDDLPDLYRDQAMRALEGARFPGARSGFFTREDAQTRIGQLLDGVDAGDGALAERILVTGSPTYERAFGKWLKRGGFVGLAPDEQAALSRALSMGSATSAQLAVPFTLDPTVILTSDGATNPIRGIARVETITGRTWEGVTSAGITVARAAEAAAASDNAPALAQPTLTPTRVQGFVPFSIESDQDWTQLRSEMTRLLADAKDVEEATSFITGNGTAPNPGGIATTLTTASNVNDGFTAFDAGDLYALDNALPPRFQPRAVALGRKNTYNLIRALDTNGTLYVRLTEGRPSQLLGYSTYEASAMPTRTTAGNRYLILGDFNQFLIVDKAGMDVEIIPHMFDVTNNMPTGQRGLYAIWRNNSAILVPNAFRGLTYAT